MTRYAKRGPDNKKKHEASNWVKLKSDVLNSNLGSICPEEKFRVSNDKIKLRNILCKGLKVKKKMQRSGEEGVLHAYLHKQHRREKRRQTRAKERQQNKVCFKCRLPGHKVEDCMMDMSDHATGLCYRCGSTEHMSSSCKRKIETDVMPFAHCFVCGHRGHISRSCPNNSNGLYPLGGGCKTCGSVKHFQRECPEFQQKQGIGSSTVMRLDSMSSADAVEGDTTSTASSSQRLRMELKRRQVKVVNL